MSIISDQEKQKQPCPQKLIFRPTELILLVLLLISFYFSFYLYNQISIIQHSQSAQKALMQRENKRMMSKYRQKINKLTFKVKKLEMKVKAQSKFYNLTNIEEMIKTGVSTAFISAFYATSTASQTLSQISKSGKQFAEDLYQKIPSSDELSKLGESFIKTMTSSETQKMVDESLSDLWQKVKSPFS